MMREKGYDIFLVSVGPEDQHLDSCDCRVCDTRCNVQRDVVGPMSWAGSIAGCKTKHDMFTCPHSNEQWHDHALSLLKAAEGMPSPTIEKIMRKDLKAIVKKGLRNQEKK
jgi:hypothetical protein